MTVCSVIRRDVFHEVNDFTFTVGGGPANVQNEAVGANVTRTLIFVCNPPGQACRFKLSQNGVSIIEELVNGDLTYSLTVTP